MSDHLPFLPPVDPARAGRAAPPTTLTPEMLASLLADGDDELAAWALRGALAERRRAEVFDGLLRDAMTLIGERWAEGRWTVAEEHLASQTVVRALDRIREERARPAASGRWPSSPASPASITASASPASTRSCATRAGRSPTSAPTSPPRTSPGSSPATAPSWWR